MIDAAPLLPSFLQLDISRQVREFYVSIYNDKFFEQPAPVWFVVFITMEIFYHAPLSIWAIGALLRGVYIISYCYHLHERSSFIITFLFHMKMTPWSPSTF